MASPTQLVQFTFAGGIDQSTRSEVLDPLTAYRVQENVRAPLQGGVVKRDGFRALASADRVDGTSRSAGYRLIPHGKQTCVIDRDVFDVLGDPDDSEPAVTRGRVPECGLSMMQIPAPPGGSGSLVITDAVRVGDYLALAYTSGASVYASVVEAETGRVIIPPALIYTGTSSEIYGLLGARGTTAMIFIVCAGETDIQVSECDCSDATSAYAGWSAAAPGMTTNNVGNLALAVHSIGSRVYVAYANDSGGISQLTVDMFDGGAGATTNIATAGGTPSACGLGGVAGDTLWVAWNASTLVQACGLDLTTLATTALNATVITAGTAPSGIGGIHVVASSTAGAARLFVNNATGGGMFYRRNFSNVGSTVTPGAATTTSYNVTMSGKPFRVGSRYYSAGYGSEVQERVAILCDLTDLNAWVRPIANIAPRQAVSIACAQATAHKTREFWFPVGVYTSGSVVGAQIAKFDFDAPYRWRPAAHNGVTFLSGGLVSYFDGVRVAESGFVIRPPAPVLSTSGAGSFTASVGISVVLTYEQVDSAGNWHISGVSDPTDSGPFTNKVNLVVEHRPLGISARISAATDPGVRTCIYASEDGGETYYFLDSIANKLTATSFTYNITAEPSGSAAMLMSTGALPGTGAQQDRRAPSGMNHLCSYNGFLVGALGETVYWSGQDIAGEGTWWNPVFQQPCSGGGDITALDAKDGTVYVFKRDRIFALAGEPPTDNGASGGLGAPMRIASDVGARLPFTCVTSLGIFFVSDRGVELLRGREVEFIGNSIRETFDDFPYVTSMTFDPASSCVLIEASSAFSGGLASGTGRTFVFDTRSGAWRSFDRRSVSASTDVPAQDGCLLWDGSAYRYAWLRSDGLVYVEEPGLALDPGDVWIRQYAKTGYVKLAGIQGQQMMNRALLLAKRSGDGDIKMAAAYDYKESFQTPQEWTSATIATLSSALGRVQVEHTLSDDAEGQAVAIEVYDEAPSDGVGDGAGCAWIALTFEGQPRANAAQLSEEAR